MSWGGAADPSAAAPPVSLSGTPGPPRAIVPRATPPSAPSRGLSSPGERPKAAIQPSNLGTVPLTRNRYRPAAMSTVVSSKVAGGIWDATNRFQMSR